MARKNAYYFSHDCNARLDEKILAVRMKHGVEGYGVYFMLIERLAEADGHTSTRDYNAIAFDFRCSAELVKAIVENFNLFQYTDDGAQFYSESLNKRMAEVDELREKRRAAGRKGGISKAERWQKCSNATNNDSKCQDLPPENVPKERKGKEIKEETTVSSISSPIGEEMSDGKPPDTASSPQERINYEKLIEYWNEKTGGKWGRLVSIDNNRRKMVKARISEHGKTALVTAIDKSAASDFLAGAVWFNFDWLIRPNNFDKIISGNYDNKDTPHGTRPDNNHRQEVTKPTGDYNADF